MRLINKIYKYLFDKRYLEYYEWLYYYLPYSKYNSQTDILIDNFIYLINHQITNKINIYDTFYNYYESYITLQIHNRYKYYYIIYLNNIKRYDNRNYPKKIYSLEGFRYEILF